MSAHASCRFRRIQCGDNRIKHQPRPHQHIVVPEPQHPISLSNQRPAATPIFICRSNVLTAIELDDQSTLRTREVSEVDPDAVLPAELEAEQLAIAKKSP